MAKKQKGFIIVFVTLVVAIVLVVAYSWVRQKEMNQLQNAQVQGGPVKPLDKDVIVKDIDISNWKTYENKEYGFELRYPSDFHVVSNDPKFGAEYSDDPTFFSVDGASFQIDVKDRVENNKTHSLNEWVAGSISVDNAQGLEEFSIGNCNAYKLNYKGVFNSGGPRKDIEGGHVFDELTRFVFIEGDKHVIVIFYPLMDTSPMTYQIFERMISTLRIRD